MHFWKRAACGALAALMILAVGCSGEDKTWAYQSGDTQLPVGAYIYTMFLAASDGEEKIREEHADDEDFTMPTKYKDLMKQTVDGKSFSDYVLENTESRIKEFFAVEDEFARRDLSLTEEQLAYASSTVAGYWDNNTAFYEKNGIAQSSLVLLTQSDLKRQALFDDIYGEGGEQEVPESQLKTKFADEYAKAEVMVFTPDYTEEGQEAQKELVQSYLQRAKDGEDLYDLIYELQREEAEDPDTVEKPEPGSYSTIVYDDLRNTYGDALVDGIFGATVGGDPIHIEDSSMNYIVQRVDILEDTDAFAYYRGTMLADLKEEEFVDLVAQWAQDVTLSPNQAALTTYTPAKMKMD